MKTKKLIYFLIIILSPIIVIFIGKLLYGFGPEWIASFITLEVGVVALLREQVSRWFFPPIFNVTVKESLTSETRTRDPQKWYVLSIKNNGFSPAKNISIKIKDEEPKSWVNLNRTFIEHRKEEIDKIQINNLSPKEEGEFNIGFIPKSRTPINEVRTIDGGDFIIWADILPNNQKMVLKPKEQLLYLLEVVADNADPYSFNVLINNKGYEEFDVSCIQIKE